MWYMWHGGIVAGRAQGIAPTMLRSHPQTCSSIVFPLPKVGIRGGEVCGHGGGKRCYYYTRYARHACIVFPLPKRCADIRRGGVGEHGGGKRRHSYTARRARRV